MQLKFSRVVSLPLTLTILLSPDSLYLLSPLAFSILCPVSLRDGAGERIVQSNPDSVRGSGIHTARKSLEALDDEL